MKYNGYSFVRFDISTGVQDADVWDLNEDNRGRMWLSRISYDMGYVQNDKYKSVFVKNFDNILYPRYIRNYPDGIIFLTSYQNNEAFYLGTEKNDTLTLQKLNVKPDLNTYISGKGEILNSEDNILSIIETKGAEYSYIKRCSFEQYREHNLLNTTLVPYPGIGHRTIRLLHTENCTTSELTLSEGDIIVNQYENDSSIYLISNTGAYVFDMQMKESVKKPFSQYLTPAQLHANSVAYMTIDSFWSTCIATTKAGMYMTYEVPHFANVITRELVKYKYTGNDNEGNQYWWNKENRTLARLGKNNNITYTRHDSIEIIEQVSPDPTSHLYMVANTNLYTQKNQNLSQLFKGLRYVNMINLPAPGLSYTKGAGHELTSAMINITGGIFKNDTFYCVRRGSGYCSYSKRNDTLINTLISAERVKGIFYDSVYKGMIVYGDNDILLHKNGKILKVSKNMLRTAGISKIETIVSDQKYGNIFIKTHDKVIVYNLLQNRFKTILNNYKLENALIHYNNGQLIAGGKFGLLFSKISGPMQFSKTILYPNIKSLAYNYVSCLQTVCSKVYLNTDSALFCMNQPHDDLFNTTANNKDNYKFICKYKDTSHVIQYGDTLWLDQHEPKIQFDIIKPDGVGMLRFTSSVSNTAEGSNIINGQELHLSQLKVDRFYRLTLQAHDDTWESPVMHLALYYVPTFWQTAAGKRITWAAAGVLLLLAVFLIIYYTRKIVSQSHLRRNYLLSLELQSIYAQINPHFIFNTLNTGLYFIREQKNDEAYTHISSFSDLLRSYIKSSRNKYISLEEELENIENYITLQQYRFEHKFDFTIETDAEIDTEQVLVPALLFQPFIENAINHGLLHKEKKGRLEIKFRQNDDKNSITCIIEDDGIGRERSGQINAANKEKPTSYGNTLIQDLIKIINADDKLRVGIAYEDKQQPDSGTRVIITIKKIT